MVDLDAALGEQLLDVAVGQPKAQVPAHRQDDDLRREAEADEGTPSDGSGIRRASAHAGSLPARGPLTADATVPVRYLDTTPLAGSTPTQRGRR